MNIMNAANTIPLSCNICTKKPDFSDVSHLLTHIASKGHLSSYYKMKVKASADPDCRRQIEEYDDWYAEWNLDDLMRERMAQKDKRSGRGSTTASRRGSAATSNSSRSTPAATHVGRNAGRQPQRQLRDSVLNPRLGRAGMLVEPYSRPATPGSAMSHNGSMNRFYAPPIASWPPTPYGDLPIKRESLGSSFSDASYEIDADSVFHPPPGHRIYGGRLSDEDGSLAIEDDWEMDETTSDAAKLKGVFWPGMAMFDSATPEMKRKRNQKKDYSVMEQLRATSEYVEPHEMIFDITGALRKQRLITGNPELEDDDSILSGEVTPEPEPPKKRQARRPRPALTEKHVNSGRVLRRRSAHGPGYSTHCGPYFDGPGSEDDDSLTYLPPRHNRHQHRGPRGLSIHRDNTGPEITFDHGAPAGYMPAGIRNNPFHSALQQNQPSFSGVFNRGHQRLPSFNFNDPNFGASFRPSSSGNTLPAPNFSSFGALNTHTLFQNNTWPAQNGHTALSSFQQQFQQPVLGTHNPIFQNTGPGQNSANWDVFASIGHPEVGLPAPADNAFQPGTELNPLFFSSNQPTPREDDEATVSPPASEH